MKISIETNVDGKVAAPALDRLLTRVVAVLEKGTGLKFDVKTDGTTVRLARKSKLLRKKASSADSIVYGASETGYSIYVLAANGQIVSEEHREDGGFSQESNLMTAEKAAHKIAAELSVDSRYVAHDVDIE